MWVWVRLFACCEGLCVCGTMAECCKGVSGGGGEGEGCMLTGWLTGCSCVAYGWGVFLRGEARGMKGSGSVMGLSRVW